VFYKDSRNIYRVPELDGLAWLEHGFGTRLVDVPALMGSLALLKQIHSATCLAAEGRTGLIGDGDALVENTPGVSVAVRTADCLPILLVDERCGTVAGIARHAVAALHARFGSKAADLHAAIGPGIGKCCYQVGPEVAGQFGENGHAHIDLAEANRAQLLEAGVTARRIYRSNLCTMCGAAEFHSYRRDREAAGRMVSYAGIQAAVQ